MADKLPIKAKWSGGSPDDVIALQEFQSTDTIALNYLSGGASPSEGHVLTWGGSPLGWITAAPDLGANNLDDLLDVFITGAGSPEVPADNEVLAYDSSSGNWINQTASEAGLSIVGHTHTLNELSNVYVSAGSPEITIGYVLTYGGSPLGWYAIAPAVGIDALDDLTNVTIASVTSGEILVYQGSPAEWQNNTLAEAGISAIGHTHAMVDITDSTWISDITSENLEDLNNVSLTGSPQPVSGDLLRWNGSTWINYPDSNFSSSGHNHTKSDITDFTESDYVHTTGTETVGGNKTFSNDIIISGDLTVNGTTTTINTTTLEIGDNIYLLNADMDDGSPIPAPTQDAGFEVERGIVDNVSWLWDETVDTFRPKLGTGEAYLGYVLDPTNDNHIGDRGYNDLRYSNISHAHAINELSDATITSLTAGEVLISAGSPLGWINQTLAEAGISSDSHTHIINDLTDITIASVTSGEILVYQGSPAEWQNNTLAEAGISAVGHTHVMVDITDSTWISDITNEPIADLSDVTINAVGSGEVLVYQGSPAEWQNNTLAEAGISAIGHTHVMVDITDSTWISDITAEPIADLSDVTVASLGAGEILVAVGSPLTWINQTLAEAGIASDSHTHIVNDLTDVTIASVGSGEVLVYQGSPAEWQNNTLAEAGISATGHTHVMVDITDSTWISDITAESLDDLSDVYTPAPQVGELLTYGGSPLGWYAAAPAGGVDALDDLTDVVITGSVGSPLTPADNELLAFDIGSGNWINQTAAQAGLSVTGHTHVMVDITDSTWISDITGEPIGDLNDVTVTSLTSGEVLLSSGSPLGWINATLAEAGISATGHTHVMVDITDSTWISDITAENIEDLNNVSLTGSPAPVSGDLLRWNGSTWTNYPDSNFSSSGHTHVKANITDFTESDYVHTTGVETVGGNKTFSNNIIISGDLTVNGTTTSINTTTLEIEDNIYLLNSGMVGSPLVAPTQDAGFEVARGTATNVSWLWDETFDVFRPKIGAAEAHLGYVLDPTNDNHVGDRGYNDLRYSSISHVHAVDDLSDATITSLGTGEILLSSGSPLGWINATLAEAGIASDSHTHILNDLTDVVITQGSPLVDNDVLAFDTTSGNWINQTAAQAGLSVTGHTHVMVDVTDSTWISDITAEPIADLSDVTVTSLTAGEILVAVGSPLTWINQTLAEAGISATGHSHTKSDITDFTESDYVHITGTETVSGAKSFTASTTKIGGTTASSEVLSVQTTSADTWLEMLNNGGTGKGAFFGLTTNDFQIWNYQAGSISFYTDTSDSSGTVRFVLTNDGNYIFSNLTSSGMGIATIDGSGYLGRDADLELLSDVTVTSLGIGEILLSSGSPLGWINATLAEAGISATGHSHTKSDITDFTESDYVHTTGVETIGGNKTFSNNVIVSGDLTVNGTTTTINTTTLEIGDNIYLLNADMDDGSPIPVPTQDAGFEVERGVVDNTSWLWDETLDVFRPKLGTGEAYLGYVLDPTNDNHVGDRGYNDLRYSNISHLHAVDDLSDATITSLTTGEILFSSGSPVGWTNATLAEAGIASDSHTHLINDLTDVIVSSVTSGEILVYQGSPAEWQNNTLAEAGISAVGHTHVMVDIADSTWISDITNEPISDLNDVTITSLAAGEILVAVGSPLTWINQTLTEAGIASSSHTHVLSDLTDVYTTGSPAPQPGDVLTYGGSPVGWYALTTAGGVDSLDDLTDVTITGTGSPEVPADNEVLAYDSGSSEWINQTPKEAGLVAGPTSSTDNAVVRWDGTNGALVQDSGVMIDDSDNVVIPGSIKISNAASPIISGVMTIEDINGQPMMCMEDTTRANKKLTIETVNIAWSESTLTNFDWMQVGAAIDADSSYIMPFDGTIVKATGHCENALGNTKDIRLYVNTTLNGTAMGTLTGGANATFNTTLNIDFSAGDRIRLRAWTGGTIRDTIVTLWIKWRA